MSHLASSSLAGKLLLCTRIFGLIDETPVEFGLGSGEIVLLRRPRLGLSNWVGVSPLSVPVRLRFGWVLFRPGCLFGFFGFT